MSKIDFTKTGVVFETRNGIYYTSEGERFDYYVYSNRQTKANKPVLKKNEWLEQVVMANLVKPVTIIHQTVGYEAVGFYPTLHKGEERDYIDLDFYYLRGCSSVGSFKQNPHFDRHYSWRRIYMIRLFKDATFIVVYQSKTHNREDDNEFYYFLNPKFKENLCTTERRYRYNSDISILDTVDSNGEHEWIRFYPTSNDDLYEYAMHNTKKSHPLHLISANDLTAGHCYPTCLEYSGHCKKMQFAKSTTNMLEKFYDIEGSGWGLWNQFKAKTHNERTNLGDLYDIGAFCYGKSGADANTAFKSRQQKITDWSERIGKLQFDTRRSRAIIWTREEDEIIATLWHSAKDAEWNHRCEEYCVFVYNVKTKKRTLVVMPAGGVPSLPIPSEDLVVSTMSIKPTSNYEYDYDTRRSSYILEHPQYEPTYLKPFDEIFKGTNIEVLLKEVKHDTQIYNFQQMGGYYRGQGDDIPMISTVGKQLDPKNLDIMALKVLVSSQEAWKEQLIKCHLFNLYFAALQMKDHFVSLAKYKKGTSYYGETGLVVNQIAKNLKKCFGMTMAQIQLVDQYVGKNYIIKSTENSNRKGEMVINNLCVPNFCGIEKDLDVEISRIDLATFKEILEVVTTCKSGDGYYYGRNYGWRWQVHENELVKEAIKNLTLRQKIETMKGFSNFSQYNDYLRMRQQLKNLSIERRDPTLYSDKLFPLRPSAATRFIRFFPGMRKSWSRLNTAYDFKNWVEREFSSEDGRNRITYAYDDNHVLLGASVSFTVSEHAKYLHDEATAWVELFQDEVKVNEFNRALKRVKPLEYTDGTLSIVAPTAPRDLKAEGSILSHCVGGFVQPIIDGTTNVVFLRKNKMLGSPFYTIEILNDGTIRQVHCYHNGGTSEEEQLRAYTRSVQENNPLPVYQEPVDILKFLRKWAKERPQVKASSIRENYGMLCANRN